MRRRTIVGISAVFVAALATSAYAVDSLPLPVGSGSAQCSVSWQAPGITFTPQTPVQGATGPSVAYTDVTGTLNLDATPTDVIDDPAKLASAVTLTLDATGGFTFSDAQGRKVEASAPQGPLPTGTTTYLVKSPASPDGVRIPVYSYGLPSTFSPSITSLLPVPALTVTMAGLRADFTPELISTLNSTFGAGTAKSGDSLGVCAGMFSTG
ncbi:hypothetical protein [Streptomyces luteireticuli]|uniref:hypothetical protein n=1 Tax=Streptomyces luteireticuli TaxID=173858 RepID=UPI003555D4A1